MISMATMPSAQNRGPQLTTRAAPFVASTLNAEARTVQLIWTTGARVMRGYYEPYFEELSLDPKHVRMERLLSGAPLLDSHDANGIAAIIGVVENATLEKGRGLATVRFDSGPAGEDAMRRVGEGTLRGVSVGYRTDKLIKVEDGATTTPVYRAIDWTPHELSLTPIGADAGAHVRSNKETAVSKKNRSQETHPAEIADIVVDMLATPATREIADLDADRERSLGIARVARVLGQQLHQPSDRDALERFGEQLVRSGASLERARAALQNEYAERGVILVDKRDPRIESGRELGQQRVELMAEALASRFGGPAPSEEARQYVRLSTVDFARHFLEQRGVNTRTLSQNQIIERSLGGLGTTGDFPNLLTGTGVRILQAAYESYKGGLQQACKQVTATDFRPIQKLQIGTVGTLKRVNEGGEYENTSMAESKEAYSLATFGRIFGLSRQALVNDDLGAFGDMATQLGRMASEFVAGQLVTLLTSNPVLADTKAVFHADHGNLGAGAALSVAALGLGMKSMRLQKGLDGVTAIDVTPKFLIVPAALETIALQTVTAITPALTTSVNPFAGKLEPIVDPRLDAVSATTWYLAADPGRIDTIEYAYLDGANGPEVIMREGFRTDGVEWKVRLDFGAGVIDHRGLYKNPGV